MRTRFYKNANFLFTEIELLSSHGVLLPPNMQGLTEDQVRDLKLSDEYVDHCVPNGGFITSPDPVGRRNGRGMLKSLSLQYFAWTLNSFSIIKGS